MNKKLLFTLALSIIAIFTFAITFTFATDGNGAMNVVNNTVNGARNVVGGAENAVEGAVNGIGNTMKNSANTTGNTINNIGNTTGNAMHNVGTTTGNTPYNGTNYNANRTATTRTAAGPNNTFLGMNSTMWTWVVLAVAVIAIVSLIWYYSSQLNNNRRYDDGE